MGKSVGPLWPRDDEVGGDDDAGRADEASYHAELDRVEEIAAFQIASALADEGGGSWADCRDC